eukprot:GHVT01103160.1.p2 GENE.GHVT01103160.1~~GHVT01103160.1.p2  ORF type:complete len:115 (-),score=13.49 GHVT01103160.1:137-481(-)
MKKQPWNQRPKWDMLPLASRSGLSEGNRRNLSAAIFEKTKSARRRLCSRAAALKELKTPWGEKEIPRRCFSAAQAKSRPAQCSEYLLPVGALVPHSLPPLYTITFRQLEKVAAP